ncbi:MAG: histidinol-phosphate transaminase [Lachnospiraceae bacterium]
MQDNRKFHGSDLELIEAYYHIPKDEIISFSANVNPLGISSKFRESLVENIDRVNTYPDRNYSTLRSELGAYCHTLAEHIIVGSGATELISMFIHGIHPQKSMILNPTYSEYGRELELIGSEVTSFLMDIKQDFRPDIGQLCNALDDSYDLLILCNPNNPTGTLFYRNDLILLLEHCKRHHIYIMIDETYVEFVEEVDAITAIPLTMQYDDLFVLRGVSKFFAAPGLRFGYGITGSEAILSYIEQVRIPWSVHALAAYAAGAMFSDVEYITGTKKFINGERDRLYGILKQESELYIYKPTANFILIRILKEGMTAADFFEHAIREGLLLRDCTSFPGLGSNHIRFCFCHPDENDRLVRNIQECLGTLKNKHEG